LSTAEGAICTSSFGGLGWSGGQGRNSNPGKKGTGAAYGQVNTCWRIAPKPSWGRLVRQWIPT
jgi:hypothetical protein